MSKIEPVLSNMPWNVKRNIVEAADTFTKLSIRQCSKEYKEHVDKSVTVYKEISLWCRSHASKITMRLNIDNINRIDLELESRKHGYSKVRRVHRENNKVRRKKTYMRNGNYVEAAVGFAAKLFKRNVSFEAFQLGIVCISGQYPPKYSRHKRTILGKLQEALSARNQLLPVKEFRLYFDGVPEDINHVLPYLRPRTLKGIVLSITRTLDVLRQPQFSLDQIAELVQWKQAKWLSLRGFHFSLPKEKYAHFEKIECFIGILDINRVYEIFKDFRTNQNVRKCQIECHSCNHRSILEHCFKFNPRITVTTITWLINSSEVELMIDIPNNPNMLFKITMSQNAIKSVITFSKVRKGYQRRQIEQTVGLLRRVEQTVTVTAAELMTDFHNYFH